MYSIMVNKLINNSNLYMDLKLKTMAFNKCNHNQWVKLQTISVLFQVDKATTKRLLLNHNLVQTICFYSRHQYLNHNNSRNKHKMFPLTSQIPVHLQISFLLAHRIRGVILNSRRSSMISLCLLKLSAKTEKTLIKCSTLK